MSDTPQLPKRAKQDRSQGYPCVTCPHCGAVNGFPEFEVIDVFVCAECGEPVEAEPPPDQ